MSSIDKRLAEQPYPGPGRYVKRLIYFFMLSSHVSLLTSSRLGVHWHVGATIDELSSRWDQAAPVDNIFLQRPYLSIVEAFPPKGVQFRYLVCEKDGLPIGVMLLQLATFDAAQNIKSDQAPRGLRENFYSGIRQAVSRRASFGTLTCGNFLLSGQHGFYFDERIPVAEQCELVEAGMQAGQASFEASGASVDGMFVKDVAAPCIVPARCYFKAS